MFSVFFRDLPPSLSRISQLARFENVNDSAIAGTVRTCSALDLKGALAPRWKGDHGLWRDCRVLKVFLNMQMPLKTRAASTKKTGAETQKKAPI